MPNDARIDTGPPPYATEDILAQPLPERLRLICKTFVHQIHGTPTPSTCRSHGDVPPK